MWAIYGPPEGQRVPASLLKKYQNITINIIIERSVTGIDKKILQ